MEKMVTFSNSEHADTTITSTPDAVVIPIGDDAAAVVVVFIVDVGTGVGGESLKKWEDF